MEFNGRRGLLRISAATFCPGALNFFFGPFTEESVAADSRARNRLSAFSNDTLPRAVFESKDLDLSFKKYEVTPRLFTVSPDLRLIPSDSAVKDAVWRTAQIFACSLGAGEKGAWNRC
jgi:hypothetical protein